MRRLDANGESGVLVRRNRYAVVARSAYAKVNSIVIGTLSPITTRKGVSVSIITEPIMLTF